jgi:hypothetical protein
MYESYTLMTDHNSWILLLSMSCRVERMGGGMV